MSNENAALRAELLRLRDVVSEDDAASIDAVLAEESVERANCADLIGAIDAYASARSNVAKTSDNEVLFRSILDTAVSAWQSVLEARSRYSSNSNNQP